MYKKEQTAKTKSLETKNVFHFMKMKKKRIKGLTK